MNIRGKPNSKGIEGVKRSAGGTTELLEIRDSMVRVQEFQICQIINKLIEFEPFSGRL